MTLVYLILVVLWVVFVGGLLGLILMRLLGAARALRARLINS